MLRLVVFACFLGVTLGATKELYIIGGSKTDIRTVPYQAVVYKDYSTFICGATIVGTEYVVTAASCVYGLPISSVAVRVGTSDPAGFGLKASAANIAIHPKFNPETKDYDVAVIKLSRNLIYYNAVQSIPLAVTEPQDGVIAKVSGWGLLNNDGYFSDTLLSVDLPIVDRQKCASYLSKYFTITPRMICAGAQDKAACQKDHGGPLQYNNRLVGVFSFKVGSAKDDLPGVYTNIADPEINKFIRKQIY